MSDRGMVKAPRALIATACVLAAAIALALSSSGCGSASATLDPVAQAAEATSRAGGAQVSIAGSMTSATLGGALTLGGGGEVNFKSDEADLVVRMSGLAADAAAGLGGGMLHLSELLKGGSMYVSSPLFDGRLPGGARWLKVDTAQVGQAEGLDPSSLSIVGGDPGQYLADLKAAGNVSVVGHDSIRGVATTHYAGTIDLLDAAETQPAADRAAARAALQKLIAESGVRNVPVEVWIDDARLVRRLSLDISGQGIRIAIGVEYFGFGSTPAVTAPSGSDVFDVTPRVLQQVTAG